VSLTAHFARLGAPLKNSRWSWGSVRESDGAVFLRVWQDQTKTVDGRRYALVTHHEAYIGNEGSPGYRERLSHVALAESGRPVYLVMCLVRDPNERPRKIKSFNKDDVFVGGAVIEMGGDKWIELADRVSVDKVRAAPPSG